MQVEIDFPGHPFLVAFCQKRGDKAQAGCRVRKDGCHAGAAFDLAIDPFETVGRAQAGELALEAGLRAKAQQEVLLGNKSESTAPGEGVRGFQNGQFGGGRGLAVRLMSGQRMEERYRSSPGNSSNRLQQCVSGCVSSCRLKVGPEAAAKIFPFAPLLTRP